VDSLIEFVDSLIEQLTAQLSLQIVDIGLYLYITQIILCAFGCLDSRIAVFFDLCSILLVLFEEKNHLRIIPDLVLLILGQFIRHLLVVFKVADSLNKIVTLYCPKVDGESITVNEVQHIVSLVDVPAIAHNLSVLFRGQGLYRTRLLAGPLYRLRSAWHTRDKGE
jgi:hypothetical protein